LPPGVFALQWDFAFTSARDFTFAAAQVAGVSLSKKASREDLSLLLNLRRYKLVS